jgi:hypothetical protein
VRRHLRDMTRALQGAGHSISHVDYGRHVEIHLTDGRIVRMHQGHNHGPGFTRIVRDTVKRLDRNEPNPAARNTRPAGAHQRHGG